MSLPVAVVLIIRVVWTVPSTDSPRRGHVLVSATRLPNIRYHSKRIKGIIILILLAISCIIYSSVPYGVSKDLTSTTTVTADDSGYVYLWQLTPASAPRYRLSSDQFSSYSESSSGGNSMRMSSANIGLATSGGAVSNNANDGNGQFKSLGDAKETMWGVHGPPTVS